MSLATAGQGMGDRREAGGRREDCGRNPDADKARGVGVAHRERAPREVAQSQAAYWERGSELLEEPKEKTRSVALHFRLCPGLCSGRCHTKGVTSHSRQLPGPRRECGRG